MADNEQEPQGEPPPLYYPPPDYGPPPAAQQWPPPPQPYGNYPGYAPAPPVNSTLILVFGILGIVLTFGCLIGGVFGPIAWVMGNNALATLNRVGDPMNQRSTVNAGRICGIVGTVFFALYLLATVGYVIFLFVADKGHF